MTPAELRHGQRLYDGLTREHLRVEHIGRGVWTFRWEDGTCAVTVSADNRIADWLVKYMRVVDPIAATPRGEEPLG